MRSKNAAWIRELMNLVKNNDRLLTIFEKKLASLNASIEESNRSGGAPQETYQKFITQQNQLKLNRAFVASESCRQSIFSTFGEIVKIGENAKLKT